MKVALTLLALGLGFVGSLWAAHRFVRVRDGETEPQAALRLARAITAGMGCMTTALLVMVLWLTSTVQESHDTTELALANGRANCETQAEFRDRYEDALVADVRLARAQLQAAVEALQDVQVAPVTIPDTSALDPATAAFVDAVVAQSELNRQADAERFSASVDRWQDELTRREATLDDLRASRPEDCPLLTDVNDIPATTGV